MIKLYAGNVLLKPSHRKQLMAWLKRAMRIGSRLGGFAMTITMHRAGKHCDVRASVRDSAGEFVCHTRQQDWRNALRDMVRMIVNQLHAQQLRMANA